MNREMSANTTLSHYHILSKIGAAGMGEVYLAHWTKNHPMFEPLRDDPGYKAMLKRLNLPE
jgi:serine/threonine protein kinase